MVNISKKKILKALTSLFCSANVFGKWLSSFAYSCRYNLMGLNRFHIFNFNFQVA